VSRGSYKGFLEIGIIHLEKEQSFKRIAKEREVNMAGSRADL